MQDGPISDVARAGLVVAGKFRLDSLIGQGGMGSVWSATHLGLGHRVAIKLVSREFVRSADALRRFDAEAKAAARLQSRHVVQVYDSGTLEDATPYIAMELLSGLNLQDRIESSGPISLTETVNILVQASKGLGRAHALGIVHRDIKPDNIFLAQSPDDEGYVVKILDFGVAKLAQGTDGDQSSTKTGTVLGTPLYMSPEQARGLRTIDQRTDIYSLGMVAYTMLTGRVAFMGESFGDILLRICTEPLPAIGSTVAVPPALESWFQRVCARDPNARCPSTQEFSTSLRAAAGDAAPRAQVPSGEHSVSASGSGAYVAPTLFDSGVSPPANTGSVSARSVSNANVAFTASAIPRSRVGPALAIGAGVAALAVGCIAIVFFVSRRHESTNAPAAQAPPQQASASTAPAATLAPPVPAPALIPSASAATFQPPAPTQRPGPPAALTKAPAHVAPPHGSNTANPASSKTSTAPTPPTKIDLGY